MLATGFTTYSKLRVATFAGGSAGLRQVKSASQIAKGQC